jgi:hypothetical protein
MRPAVRLFSTLVSAGYYHSNEWGQDYPRIHILTIDDLLHFRSQVKMSPHFGTFKQVQQEFKNTARTARPGAAPA